MNNILNYMDKSDTLIFDLDGTLLRSDMLHESFWAAFSQNWRTPIVVLGALSRGRAELKARLAASGQPDVTSLPYSAEHIALAKNWRQRGGRVVMATASDSTLAEEIAAHLGIFDAVHGSDGVRNLKGTAKADFLVERYGEGGFIYVGDSHADLPVWKAAALAITTNASPSLRRDVELIAPVVEHMGESRSLLRAHLQALRPHQWLKNVLVFLPLLAAHQFDMATLLAALMAFISFSMIASSVYVLNDLLDLAADRAHPRKRNRPFAAGAVPISHGTVMAGGLFGLGLLVALAVGPAFAVVMLIYFTLTAAYSLRLKRLAIIDICVLAGLYSLRIVAGGVATGIALSVWLLAFAMFFFLALAAVKRQAELVDSLSRSSAGTSGRDYRAEDLPFVSMVALVAGMISVLIMALYINSDAVRLLYPTPDVLWAICVVLLYWIMRTVLIAHRGNMHDDPVIFAVKDRTSHVCFALIFIATLAGAVV